MGQVIHVDFLFARMCRDVKNWYDRYYFGADKERRKSKHLDKLEEMYPGFPFSKDPVTREKEVASFLYRVQTKINGYSF